MNTNRDNDQLTLICHPYLFALKEGKEIYQDPMDYSLLLLQRNCTEVIKSPELRFRDIIKDSISLSAPFTMKQL